MRYTEPRYRTRAFVLVEERHGAIDHARQIQLARGEDYTTASLATDIREVVSHWLIFTGERLQPSRSQTVKTTGQKEQPGSTAA